MPDNQWKINLFGSLCAVRGNEVVTQFRTHKTGALLAYLANGESRVCRREEIVEMLWPHANPAAGRLSLRVALNWLRRKLEDPYPDAPPLLIADNTHIQLNPPAYTTDKAEFETLLKNSARAGGEKERAGLLIQAAALYRPEFLSGYEEEWISRERQRLADVYVMALRRLVKALAVERDFEAALAYAHQSVEVDPYREESHRVLMKLYSAMGRPAAVQRQYKQLESLLREELGAAPSAATRALAGQTSPQVGETALSSAVTSVLEPSASYPSAPRPAKMPLSFVPTANLPVPLTRFFGREDSLAEIVEMLDTPETRLITLTGAPGCGKTRLALAVAEQMRPELAGAAWQVPLASVSDARHIPDAIMQALRLPRPSRGHLQEMIVEALAYRPCLLILDNFEHLVDEGALFVQNLLEQAPNLLCLVTSRRRLNIAGEYEFSVPPLPTPAMPGTPERLLEFAGVRLFVDRAQMVRPVFQLDKANAFAVAAVCRHLEGVPLAIELAAAWAQTLTPAQLMLRLDQRFRMLVSRQKHAAPRHTSLRAALDWSFDLLEDETRAFFPRLAVFRGGWSLAAVEAVCGETSALEYLTQLRERSLLTAEALGAEMRFGMLETVREYAQEQLSDAERASLAERHAVYYRGYAEEAEPHLHGPEAATWLDGLEREIDNLRAALAWSLKSAAGETGLRLAGALWRFWLVRGYFEEGADWLAKTLHAGADAPKSLLVKALNGAGNLAYRRGQYEAAQSYYEACLTLHREMEDTRGIAADLGSLGNVANDRGDLAAARARFEESLALFRDIGDSRGTSLSLANLALVVGEQGDYEAAIEMHQESLRMFREAGDTENVILAINNTVHNLLKIEDYNTASELLKEAFLLHRSLGCKWSLALSVTNLGALALRERQMERTALLFGAAAALRDSLQTALSPKESSLHERDCQAVRSVLGTDAFMIAWQRGREMTTEEIIRYVLNDYGETRLT